MIVLAKKREREREKSFILGFYSERSLGIKHELSRTRVSCSVAAVIDLFSRT